jgi:hypothetical protein
MLEWKNIEGNKWGEIIAQAGNMRYLVGLLTAENCWCVSITDRNSFKSLWLTENSLAIYPKFDSGLLPSEYCFATKEKAIEIAERHYRLLILQ